MKGWLKDENGVFSLKELTPEKQNNCSDNLFTIKLTKSLITDNDVLNFKNQTENNFVLGTCGIGIISSDVPEDSVFDLKKGDKVYVRPYRACGECINCKNGNYQKCSNILVAGEDYDGFLKEFTDATEREIRVLPEGFTEDDALYICKVSLALSIIDRLNVQKGEHVVILGADNLGIILAMLLKYYQSIPIIIDNDNSRIALAKECGIYYSIDSEKDWIKEVTEITGGRMATHVVYLQNSCIPLSFAFNLSAQKATIAFSGVSKNSNIISFYPAVKKELNLVFVRTGYGNTMSSVNLIANKAIDLKKLSLKTIKFEEVGDTFNTLLNDFENNKKIDDIVVEMI